MSTLDSLLIAPEFVDALYRRYTEDPSSVPPDAAALFSDLDTSAPPATSPPAKSPPATSPPAAALPAASPTWTRW